MHNAKLEFWIDVNLPPSMAKWIMDEYPVSAKSFAELNIAHKSDFEIFQFAMGQIATVIITTKDIDFVNFHDQHITTPKILKIQTGNISNKALKKIILSTFQEVIRLFTETNQTLVEINITQ